MRKNNIVKPTGLKGNQAIDRMRKLMDITPIKESVSRSVVEITKEGPDGKIYGIVRENHEYYIKVTDKKSNLMTEDFNYMGGLQNKKDKAYPSYAKAIKMLNLKFMSLNDAKGSSSKVNVFVNDNLLNEHHDINPNTTLSATKGMGDADEYVVDKSGEKLDYKSKEGKEKDGFGDNVGDGKSGDYEDVKLSENEMAIDEMLSDETDCTIEEEVEVNETRKGFSIAKAVAEMVDIVETIENTDTIDLNTLNESDKNAILSILKKKA